MLGMKFLRLNKMLAKHKHTPRLGQDEDVPSTFSDPDFRLLAIIVLGALYVGFTAWASWERTAANSALNRWAVFITLALTLIGLYSLWLRTDDAPIRARQTIAVLGIIGGVVAFAGSVIVGNMLETYLFTFSVYLLTVGLVSLIQRARLSKAINQTPGSDEEVT